MTLTNDGYRFDFPSAIDLFKFDEEDKSNALHYHGMSSSLKAVDVIVELPDRYLWIEAKALSPRDWGDVVSGSRLPKRDNKTGLQYWTSELCNKFKDTYLYRLCENKVDKPIHFIGLLNFPSGDSVLVGNFITQLKGKLPINDRHRLHNRWTRDLIAGYAVVSPDIWNANPTLSTLGTITKLP